MTLDKIQIGASVRIIEVGGRGSLRQHFLDMGMIPGNDILCVPGNPYDASFALGQRVRTDHPKRQRRSG